MAGWGPRGPGASEHCGCIGPGCGFQFTGGGFAATRLTFHQLRGSPGCLGQVRALEGEFGEGQKVDGWACGSARGSMRGVESLSWARRASSGRSQDAAAAAPPRAGEDRRVAVRVSGRRDLPALRESGVSRPGAILNVPDLRPAPRPSDPGPDAELRGRAQVPAEPKPSRCHAQRGLTLFFFLILPTHFHQGNPGRPAVLRVVPGDTPPTLGGDPTPKVKRERVPPPALVGGCPEVPNFSLSRGR